MRVPVKITPGAERRSPPSLTAKASTAGSLGGDSILLNFKPEHGNQEIRRPINKASKSANRPSSRSESNLDPIPGCFPKPKAMPTTTLVIGKSGDQFEREAEQVAGQVLAMPEPGGLIPGHEDHRPSTGASASATNVLQTARQPSAGLFPDQSGAAQDLAPASVERVLSGSGRPLEPALRIDMEHRFGHDFSRVRIHADQSAEQSARDIGARAYTVGNHIVFGDARFAPAMREGRGVIAHELTHVVQQLESGRAPRSVQRFEEGEHKGIGDAATGQRTIYLAPDLPVSYGDIVALAGDYFGDWATLRHLANTPGITEGTRGEVRYAVLVRVRADSEGTDPAVVEAQGLGKLFDLKAKAAVIARFNALAAHNVAHFPNPQRGDTARPPAAKDAGPGAIGAGASYRQNHAQALLIAAAIGQSKAKSFPPHAHHFGAGEGTEGLNDALFIEAFADHFLTDAFSAGHQQTERASVQSYWDARVPYFWNNFQIWLADHLVLHARAGAHVNPQWAREQFALPKVRQAVAKIPPLGFGDVVSGALHAYFNKYGAQADVAGRRITLVGDSNLLTKAVPNASLSQKERAFQPKDDQLRHVTDKSKDTFDAATAAVNAGIAEVYEAFDLGRRGEDPLMVPDKILRTGSGTFAAEQLLPKLAPDATVTDPRQRSINPYLGSYADLLVDPRLVEGLAISLDSYADLVASNSPGLVPTRETPSTPC